MKFKYLFISFIAGMVLMSVELTATRILAPIVGLSIYTWTSAIGIMLLGLTLGSYLGGWLIDRFKKEKVEVNFLILAAIFIALIPLISRWISKTITFDFPLIFIILFLSLILFFLPALFLGAIYPILLKLFTEELETIGKKSGLLSAFWSLGSIVGTFLTGFYFIEFLGSTRTLYLLSLILILPIFFTGKIFKKLLVIVLIIFSLVLTDKWSLANNKKENSANKIFESESNYYKIRVMDDFDLTLGNLRILLLDMDAHSVESKDGRKLNNYTEIYPIFKFFKKDLEKIYVIGGGSYSMAKGFSREYPLAEVVVSEIDPKVTKTAENFFNLNEYPIKTIFGDARINLMKDGKKYDLIFGDAYNSFISLPWHLTTIEFNDLVKDHLKNGGIYVVNFISALKLGDSLFFQSMLKTFRLSFPNVYIFVFGDVAFMPQNVILVGVNSDEKINLSNIDDDFFQKYRTADNFSVDDGLVLRDNFAPLERLMSPLIRDYFSSYARFNQLID
ncbi:MAG: fused MFS/spermidine synthase [Patescibacteria group bacterium]